MSKKLISGGDLPAITLPLVGGGEVSIGTAIKAEYWQVVIVYRGLHCPLCKKYLKKLNTLLDGFEKTKAEVVVVSGDSLQKAEAMVAETGITAPVTYGLSIEQMQDWGLYISQPRNDDETDRPFAEPATFCVNEQGKLQLIDMSNTPFNRADLDELLDTVDWVRENDYPIRGTYGS